VCVDTRARTHAHTHVHVHSHCTVRTRTHSYRHGRRLTLTIYEAVLNPYARYSRLWLSTGACTRACTPSHSAPNASPGLLYIALCTFHTTLLLSNAQTPVATLSTHLRLALSLQTHFQCVSMSRCRPRCTAVHTDNTRSIYVCSATSIFRLGNQIVDV
jgi:hypothetical protein